MIFRKHASSSALLSKLRIVVDGPRPTGSQWSTAHLIEPQTFSSLVSGEKRIIRKEILKILLNKLELKLQLSEVKKAARCRQPFLYLMNNP